MPQLIEELRVVAASNGVSVALRPAVDRLVDLVPGETPIEEGFAASPHPAFAERQDEFMSALLSHLR